MLGAVSRKMIALGVAIAVSASAPLASASTAIASPAQISPTVAAALRMTGAPALNPMVALSILGSNASAVAVCGSVASSAVASATNQTPVAGCVLPVVDTPVLASATQPPPPGFLPVFGPLLAALGAMATGAAVVVAQNDNPPISAA